MIKVNKAQREALEKAGLLRHRITKNGKIIQDSNFYVANKQHCSRDKTWYVSEEYKIMVFLGLIKPRPKKKGNSYDTKRNNKKSL